MKREAVRVLELSSDQGPQALEAGTVDYAILWEPQILNLRKRVAGSNRMVLFRPSGDDYEVLLHLVARPATIEQKRKALKAFLRSVNEASEGLVTGGDGARIAVEIAAKHQPGELKSLWNVSGIEGAGKLKFGLVPSKSSLWNEEIPSRILAEMEWVENREGKGLSVEQVRERLFDPSVLEELENE